VIEPTVTHEVPKRTNSTRFRVLSTEDQARNARVHDCAGTHRARFQGDNQGCALESPRPERASGGPKRDDFCVRSGIAICLASIAAGSQQRSVRCYNHSTDGNVSCCQGSLRFS